VVWFYRAERNLTNVRHLGRNAHHKRLSEQLWFLQKEPAQPISDTGVTLIAITNRM
jgi:hypothetical protein